MSDDEAKGILTAEFLKLRAAGYRELVDRLAEQKLESEVVGQSGQRYHLELEGFWDDDRKSSLRVVASIDDGGARVLLPFTDSFTISSSDEITEHAPA